MGTLGFAYNPFAHLHAEADPHLAEYWSSTGGHLSSHEASVLIFGRPGSGKTAKRLRLQRDLEMYQHVLPVPFNIPSTAVVEHQSKQSSDVLSALVCKAVAAAVFLHYLRHARACTVPDDTLLASARMFDAWLPMTRWRERVREAAHVCDWSDVLGRLNGEHTPASDAGIALVLHMADAPGDPQASAAIVLPAEIEKVVLMADDFDADALRTPAMIATLAVHLWKMRVPARRTARTRASMFGREVDISVQLYLPQAARTQVLRRIKGNAEIYDIHVKNDDLLQLANRRLRAACPKCHSLEVLLQLCKKDAHLIIAEADGLPRQLIYSVREALLGRAEEWRRQTAPARRHEPDPPLRKSARLREGVPVHGIRA
jgi:hypothetical protein